MSLGYCIGNISRIHSFAIIFIVLYEFDSLKWKKNYVKISVEKISWNQFFGLDIYKLIPFSNLLLDVIVIGLKMTSRGLNYPNTKTLPCWSSLPKFEFVRFPSKSLLFIVKIEIMGFLLSDLMELREITLNFWHLWINQSVVIWAKVLILLPELVVLDLRRHTENSHATENSHGSF